MTTPAIWDLESEAAAGAGVAEELAATDESLIEEVDIDVSLDDDEVDRVVVLKLFDEEDELVYLLDVTEPVDMDWDDVLVSDFVEEVPRDEDVRVEAVLSLVDETTFDKVELWSSNAAGPRKDAGNDRCELL